MPRVLSPQEKVERCVAHYDDLLAARDVRTALSECPVSQLRVVLQSAGRQKMSPRFLVSLEAAFAERGIATHPALSDETLARHTRIHFFRTSDPIVDLPIRTRHELFSEERQLEMFIVSNHRLLDYCRRDGLTLVRSEHPFPNRDRIDLLFVRNAPPRELVGVELKHEYPGDRIVGQTERYLEDLEALAATKGIDLIRLVIITGQPDPVRERGVASIAAARGARVDWLLYRVELGLEERAIAPT